MDKKALTDNLESRLDDFFGQDEEPVQKQATPHPPENKKFPLQELKAVVLSLDWEISDKSMDTFINQIDRLSISYKDDKMYMAFLSILGSLGRYINQRKVDSHPNAIKILISVFNSLEKIVLSKDIIDTEKNIILFGFMGTGKSAIARLLGERLDRPVVEMDEVIEEQEGMTISRLFAEKGEAYFRNRERELVGELSQAGGKIIATGGGVVLNPANIKDLRRSGVLICLNARAEVILKRVRDEVHRPLLEVGDRLEMIERILEDRRLLYDRIDHQIDTSDMTVDQVVEEVLTMVS